MRDSQRTGRGFLDVALIASCGFGSIVTIGIDWRVSVLWAAACALFAIQAVTSRYRADLEIPDVGARSGAPLLLLPISAGTINLHSVFISLPLLLLSLVFGLMALQSMQRRVRPSQGGNLAIVLLVVMTLATTTRGFGAGFVETLSTLILLLLILLTGLWSARNLSQERMLLTLRLGLTLFLAVNFAALVLGAESEASTSYLGGIPPGETWLGEPRVLFPLAGGLNLFGIGSACLLVLAVALRDSPKYLSPSTRLVWLLVDIVLSTGALVLVGARIALVAGLSIAVLLVLRQSIIPRLLVPSAVFLTVSLWWGPVVGALHLEPTGFASLSNRSAIWDSSLVVLGESEVSDILLGRGSYGHFTSGASLSYDHLFAGWIHPLLAGPHNSILQIVLDGGILALGLAVISIAITLTVLRSLRPATAIPVSAVLAVLLICSAFESGILWTSRWSLPGVVLLLVLFVPSARSEAASGPTPSNYVGNSRRANEPPRGSDHP